MIYEYISFFYETNQIKLKYQLNEKNKIYNNNQQKTLKYI